MACPPAMTAQMSVYFFSERLQIGFIFTSLPIQRFEQKNPLQHPTNKIFCRRDPDPSASAPVRRSMLNFLRRVICVPERVELLGESGQVLKKGQCAPFNGMKLPVFSAFNRMPATVIGEISASGHGHPNWTVQALIKLVDVGAEQEGRDKIKGRVGSARLSRGQTTITPQRLVDIFSTPSAL